MPEKMVEMVAWRYRWERMRVKRRVFERKEENRKESKEWVSRPRENKVD